MQSDPGPTPTAPASLVGRVFSVPTLVSLALAGAFLAFLATRLEVDPAATWQQLRSANPLYLLLAVAIHYTTFLFRGLRWKLLLNNAAAPGERQARTLQCARMVLLGWFANSVAWLRLGDAYRAYLYHEDNGAPFVRTVGSIVSERLLDAATVVILLVLCLPFIVGPGLGLGLGLAWTVTATAAGLLVLLVVAILAVAAFGHDGPATVLLTRYTSWLPARFTAWVAFRFRQFRDGAIQSLRRVPLAALWGLLGWLAEIARLYLVTQALGLDLSLALVVFLTLANSLLTLVPTPGGIGAVEAGLGGLLKQLTTLSTPAALALVLVDRAISYLSVIVTGAVLFILRWLLGRRGDRRGSTGA